MSQSQPGIARDALAIITNAFIVGKSLLLLYIFCKWGQIFEHDVTDVSMYKKNKKKLRTTVCIVS